MTNQTQRTGYTAQIEQPTNVFASGLSGVLSSWEHAKPWAPSSKQ